MKPGEVYLMSHYTVKDSSVYFLVVEDYGKIRPLIIKGGSDGNFFMNMAISVSPKNSENVEIYNRCEKVADTLTEFVLKYEMDLNMAKAIYE